MNRETLRRTWTDPALFNRVWLGRPDLWEKQHEIAEAVKAGKKTILAPSGNSTGKSWFCANLILWFIAQHEKSIAVTTAPTGDLLANVLWRATFGALDGAPVVPFRHRTTREPLLIENQETGGYAIGLSPRTLEGTSGHHAGRLLALTDETSGITSERISALNSLNPSLMVMIGNPLWPEGEFYERCQRQEIDPDPNTALIRLRSDETPAVKAGIQRSETGLADLDFLERSRRDYGEGSDWWKIHIEAQFPGTSEGQLVLPDWMDRAVYAKPPNRLILDPGPLWLGVDIAGGSGNDSSAIVARDDLGITQIEESRTTRPDLWARRTVEIAKTLGIPGHRVIYDKTGIGETFGDLLESYGLIGAIGFMGGSGTSPKFENLRAAAYWQLGRRLNPDLNPQPFHIPAGYGERLRRELQATRYQITAKSKIQIIPKKDIAARIGHSPDWADALSMTFAFPY